MMAESAGTGSYDNCSINGGCKPSAFPQKNLGYRLQNMKEKKEMFRHLSNKIQNI
jgi:hypothetical protein